ncbi:MAG: leucine-rich repeat domain-containing protein, partial [Culicoidibacterales bacterium]
MKITKKVVAASLSSVLVLTSGVSPLAVVAQDYNEQNQIYETKDVALKFSSNVIENEEVISFETVVGEEVSNVEITLPDETKTTELNSDYYARENGTYTFLVTYQLGMESEVKTESFSFEVTKIITEEQTETEEIEAEEQTETEEVQTDTDTEEEIRQQETIVPEVTPSTAQKPSDSITFSDDEKERYFIFNAETQTIVGYSADVAAPKNIVIPEQINGIDVLHIGDNAFAGQQLTGLTLNRNLQTIGVNAFQNNIGIQGSLVIPDTVQTIGTNAFEGTTLSEIHISTKLQGAIAGEPWGTVQADTTVYWLDVVKVEPFIFNTTTKTIIKYVGDGGEITIPDQLNVNSTLFPVEAIGNDVFKRKAITAVEFGKNLHTIGASAFEDTKLTSVEIPDNVTTMGRSIFANTPLVEVRLGKGLKAIPIRAFYNNRSLEKINIPEGTLSIGSEAFYNTGTLKEVGIPTTVTTIGSLAFANSGLTSIEIPDSVTSIEHSAFQNARELNVVKLGTGISTLSTRTFSGTGLTSIEIPDSVTTIESEAFASTKLINVEIPDSVT